MLVHSYIVLESESGFKQCKHIVMSFLSLRSSLKNACTFLYHS